jgi:hypothetical protein
LIKFIIRGVDYQLSGYMVFYLDVCPGDGVKGLLIRGKAGIGNGITSYPQVNSIKLNPN